MMMGECEYLLELKKIFWKNEHRKNEQKNEQKINRKINRTSLSQIYIDRNIIILKNNL